MRSIHYRTSVRCQAGYVITRSSWTPVGTEMPSTSLHTAVDRSSERSSVSKARPNPACGSGLDAIRESVRAKTSTLLRHRVVPTLVNASHDHPEGRLEEVTRTIWIVSTCQWCISPTVKPGHPFHTTHARSRWPDLLGRLTPQGGLRILSRPYGTHGPLSAENGWQFPCPTANPRSNTCLG